MVSTFQKCNQAWLQINSIGTANRIAIFEASPFKKFKILKEINEQEKIFKVWIWTLSTLVWALSWNWVNIIKKKLIKMLMLKIYWTNKMKIEQMMTVMMLNLQNISCQVIIWHFKEFKARFKKNQINKRKGAIRNKFNLHQLKMVTMKQKKSMPSYNLKLKTRSKICKVSWA